MSVNLVPKEVKGQKGTEHFIDVPFTQGLYPTTLRNYIMEYNLSLIVFHFTNSKSQNLMLGFTDL